MLASVDWSASPVGAPSGWSATLRAAVDLVEDTRARLALNVTYELACEALAYRLERLLAS